jgi:PKD repeat protein
LNANPPSGTASAPVTVFFDTNGTFDPDNPNELLVYFWDFGNGSFSSSPSASTTYTKAGSYNVYLDVTDRKGSTTNRNIIYVVNAATTGDTTGGTTTGPITNGDTTTGGTTTGGTTTGGNTTGGNTNSTPVTGSTNTTTPPITPPVTTPTTPPTTTTVNNGTTNTTTNGTTTNWFNNPANQVPPASGPIVDPNIQGTG